MMQVILLESIGSCIDKDGNLYPLNCDGTPDISITKHIKDMDSGFWDRISEDDGQRIAEVLKGRLDE